MRLEDALARKAPAMYSAIADAIEAEYGPLTEAQRSAVADVLAACLRACAAELSDRLGLK